MTKEELLENVDKHYEEFLTNYQKQKDELIAILSPGAAKAAIHFGPKSKDEWLKDRLDELAE
jgi:hypothetical protein